MTDYTKLVEALRWCDASFLHECDNCLYVKYKHCKDDCMDRMLRDAADAIEEMRKVNRELTELYEDAVKQLPKRGKWVGVSPMVDTVQCSVCGGQLFSAELETPYCPYCGAKMEVQE